MTSRAGTGKACVMTLLKTYLMDMEGVLVRGTKMVPGADEFIGRLNASGDTMTTDILAGVQSGMETILVLTGVTRRDEAARFPYQPNHICESAADIELNWSTN